MGIYVLDLRGVESLQKINGIVTLLAFPFAASNMLHLGLLGTGSKTSKSRRGLAKDDVVFVTIFLLRKW